MFSQEMVREDGSTFLPIHYVVDGKVVCLPRRRPSELAAAATRPFVYQRSDDVRGVTCPGCMDTEVFRQAQDELQASLAAQRATV